jgi:hypothetical protein
MVEIIINFLDFCMSDKDFSYLDFFQCLDKWLVLNPLRRLIVIAVYF